MINAQFNKLDALQPLGDGKDVAAMQNLQLTIQSHMCVGDSRETEILLWKPPRDQVNETSPIIKATREVGGRSNK